MPLHESHFGKLAMQWFNVPEDAAARDEMLRNISDNVYNGQDFVEHVLNKYLADAENKWEARTFAGLKDYEKSLLAVYCKDLELAPPNLRSRTCVNQTAPAYWEDPSFHQKMLTTASSRLLPLRPTNLLRRNAVTRHRDL